MSEQRSGRPSPSGGGRAASEVGPPRPMGRAVAAAVALAVGLPVLVTGLSVSLRGWYPAVDDGYIATRAYDVWTGRTPLLGQYSLTGGTKPPVAHSPGPMLYWLVSIPARLGPPWLTPAFMSLVSALLLGWVVFLARRRGGVVFMWVTAVGLVLLVRAFDPVTLASVWNPWAGLVPFTALAFVCWSVADGERRLLPAGVLLASFTMQAHLTYFLGSIALLAVAVAGGWGLSRWTGEVNAPAEAADAETSPSPVPRPTRWWPPLLVASVVGVACWAMPVYQQLTNQPGNVTLISRAATVPGARGGATSALSLLSRTVGLHPKFTRPVPLPLSDLVSVQTSASTGAVVGCATVLILLAAVSVLAIRRRDRTVLAGAAVAAALLAGLVLVATKIPIDQLIVSGYTFRWFAMAGLVTWLVIGLGAARIVGGWRAASEVPRPARLTWRDVGRVRPNRPVSAGAMAIGVILVLAAGLLVPRPNPNGTVGRPSRQLAHAVLRHSEPGKTYLVGRSGVFDLVYTSAEVWALRTHGRFPILPGDLGDAFGSGYGIAGRRCDGIFVLSQTSDPPIRGARTLARIDTTFPDAKMRVDLVPDRSRRGSC